MVEELIALNKNNKKIKINTIIFIMEKRVKTTKKEINGAVYTVNEKKKAPTPKPKGIYGV